jgi:hypothetical protein
MDLPLAAALYGLGFLETETLRDVATEAVAAGSESQSLALLAGALPCEHPADLRELFEAGLREAGVAMPDRLAAADTLKRYYGGEVVARRMAPRDGAWWIKRVHDTVETLLPPIRVYVGDNFGIAELIGYYFAFDDYDDDDPHCRELEAGIVQECEKIVEPTEPRA